MLLTVTANQRSEQIQGRCSTSLTLHPQLGEQKLHGVLRETSGWREEIMFQVNDQPLHPLQRFAGERQRNHSQTLPSSPYLAAACSRTALFYGQGCAAWCHPRAVGRKEVRFSKSLQRHCKEALLSGPVSLGTARETKMLFKKDIAFCSQSRLLLSITLLYLYNSTESPERGVSAQTDKF